MSSSRHRMIFLALLALSMTMVNAFSTLASDAQSEFPKVLVKPNAAVRLAALPLNVQLPEGIAVNPATGEIFVATFNPGGSNWLLRLNQGGRILAMKKVPLPLVGLAFNPDDESLYMAQFDFAMGSILKIDGGFDTGTPLQFVASLFPVGAPPDRSALNFDGTSDEISFRSTALNLPNALTFSREGDLFVSESFHGAIFRIVDATTCAGCTAELLIQDGLLATANELPPVGANGLAFDRDETMLYVANTGDDRILRLDMSSMNLEIFAEAVDGADGIAFGEDGVLWVAANQADEVVALDEDGRLVAEFGEFLGIRNDGSVRGLLFPASLAILDNKIYVTNLSLPFAGVPGQPEEEVSRYSVAGITISGREVH